MPGKEIIVVFKTVPTCQVHIQTSSLQPLTAITYVGHASKFELLIKVPDHDQPKWWTHKVEKFWCQRAHDMRRQHNPSLPTHLHPHHANPLQTLPELRWRNADPIWALQHAHRLQLGLQDETPILPPIPSWRPRRVASKGAEPKEIQGLLCFAWSPGTWAIYQFPGQRWRCDSSSRTTDQRAGIFLWGPAAYLSQAFPSSTSLRICSLSPTPIYINQETYPTNTPYLLHLCVWITPFRSTKFSLKILTPVYLLNHYSPWNFYYLWLLYFSLPPFPLPRNLYPPYHLPIGPLY